MVVTLSIQPHCRKSRPVHEAVLIVQMLAKPESKQELERILDVDAVASLARNGSTMVARALYDEILSEESSKVHVQCGIAGAKAENAQTYQ